MAADPVVDFGDLEPHKENIRPYPSGRSARALAATLSPRTTNGGPPPHDVTRQQHEEKLQAIEESDDPVGLFTDYVKWIMETYPDPKSNEARLSDVLERAKEELPHILGRPGCRDDPRYVDFWIKYILNFMLDKVYGFSDMFSHGVGIKCAPAYVERAQCLEGHRQWESARAVYLQGIENQAEPVTLLKARYDEFEQRDNARGPTADNPSSPQLPVVRPALADKSMGDDAFGTRLANGSLRGDSRVDSHRGTAPSKRGKLSVFTDHTEQPRATLDGGSRQERLIPTAGQLKKENTQDAQPWAGQTLNGGKRNIGVEKMAVYKDQSLSESMLDEMSAIRECQQAVNPRTGKVERVFVNLRAVYPNVDDPFATEFCFEELRARSRGWMRYDWNEINRREADDRRRMAEPARKETKERKALEPKHVPSPVHDTAVVPITGTRHLVALNDVNDENAPPSHEDVQRAKLLRKQRQEERANKTRQINVREFPHEAQTIQANLDSPTTRAKFVRRKKGTEPTMTVHTKEAMNEIYDIFNQPLKQANAEEDGCDYESDDGDNDGDDGYTTAGDSTCTGRVSGTESEYGDETTQGDVTFRTTMDDDDVTSASRASQWSEYTESRRVSRGDAPDTCEDESEETGTWIPDAPEADGGGPTAVDPASPALLADMYATEPADPTQPQYHRLPFLTPITEATESSYGASSVAARQKDELSSKTPSRQTGSGEANMLEDLSEELSRSLNDILGESREENSEKIVQPALSTLTFSGPKSKPAPLRTFKPSAARDAEQDAPSGPVIPDRQCNPMDVTIQQTILEKTCPPLSRYEGYHENRGRSYAHQAEIKRFVTAIGRAKSGGDKATGVPVPPVLRFEPDGREYSIKQQLGEGGFAPVYLAESKAVGSDEDDGKGPPRMGKGAFASEKRKGLEAIKMEQPPSAWEFYMIRQAHRRLGIDRASASIVRAHELHLFRDECYLVLEYRDQGTLLDLVNLARTGPTSSGGPGVMDEQLVMFFTIELLRTAEALHAKGIIHGDLKADNVLARLEQPSAPGGQWSSQYRANGSDGWSAKGVTLIDLGRSIDMRAFAPHSQFVADWPTNKTDCVEMREMRPWTFQADYHGLAGIVHSLLFGSYIETVADKADAVLGAGASKTYRLREKFRRYHQDDLWTGLFDLLLNPTKHVDAEEGQKLPVLRGMKRCRESMERWLEVNCEKGTGLKTSIRRIEESMKGRKGRPSG